MVTLNCYSAEWTLHINSFVTSAKLAAIAIIIDCSIYQLAFGIFIISRLFQLVCIYTQFIYIIKDLEGNAQYLNFLRMQVLP